MRRTQDRRQGGRSNANDRSVGLCEMEEADNRVELCFNDPRLADAALATFVRKHPASSL
jgi:hypothetical protein